MSIKVGRAMIDLSQRSRAAHLVPAQHTFPFYSIRVDMLREPFKLATEIEKQSFSAHCLCIHYATHTYKLP